MKKFSILFLATVFMVAGTAYLISLTGTDKAGQQAIRDNVLSLKKAMLGSTGLEITKADQVSRSRSRLAGAKAEKADEATDEGGDGGGGGTSSPACSVRDLRGTVAPGTSNVYTICCDPTQIIKLDAFSERLGAPTDVALTVDDGTSVLFSHDDGRGLGGTSTDACLIFKCPLTGQYNITLSNLTDPATGFTKAQSGYDLQVSVLCNLEVEPNPPATPQNLNCTSAPFAGAKADEGADEAADEGGETTVSNCHVIAGEFGGAAADIDCFSICLAAGETLTVDIDSGECDNLGDADQVDPVLVLTDAAGNVVAADDDTESVDPNVIYTSDLGGTYELCLSDARLTNPGVYSLSWCIFPASTITSVNCP